ncbi:unnamed protein product [Prorocentrum cordatum]|uniref:Uncharacterized protein n=1 Tax=Prorocentrum cordatum TaxID=2364126 RepID=A0ABN9T756_9DINO|nr:unnamed protein product [Polarella glacialis]
MVVSTAQPAAETSFCSVLRALPSGSGPALQDIREKSVISPYANTGAYIFKSAKAFKAAAEDILSAPEEAAKTGLYASILISSMLAKGVGAVCGAATSFPRRRWGAYGSSAVKQDHKDE